MLVTQSSEGNIKLQSSVDYIKIVLKNFEKVHMTRSDFLGPVVRKVDSAIWIVIFLTAAERYEQQ